MDIDAFAALREPRWARLRALSRKRRRTGAEADEMTRLYRSTAADLAAVRAAAPEPALIVRLSMVLGSSRIWLTGTTRLDRGDLARLFTRSLPVALYRVRWWGLMVTLAVVVMSAVTAQYALTHPDTLHLIGSDETLQQVAQEEFASYYQQYDNTSFAAQVWTNNAWLAAQAITLGITVIFPLILMYNTVLQLGLNAAIMAKFDALDVYFQLLAPHGLLELSAVFIATGAGLRMFWTLLVPGPRPRAVALAEAFRTNVLVALGLTIALFVSGLVEGFVTPSNLPWALKVGLGVIACGTLWTFVFVGGRVGLRGGVSGDVGPDMQAEQAPFAA